MSDTLQTRDFPRSGTLQEQLRFLLEYAVLAPSSHNTQPWLWQIEFDEVTLRADRARAMPALDPQGRELIMSCGAALQHFRLATRYFGCATLLQLWPEGEDSDLLARVRIVHGRPPTDDNKLLFGFITKRHTHRGEFEARALPAALLRTLQEDAEVEDATLHFAQSEEQRESLAELIERGDLEQNRDPNVRRDVADWIAVGDERKDGIPTDALGIDQLFSHFAPLTHRLFDQGETLARKDGEMARNAPVLAVLSTTGEGPKAWLDAGQALGRVLLRARSRDVWASFFSQPIQVDAAWTALRHIIGIHDYPQLIFRLGYAAPVGATPRRSVEEVVEKG